MKTRRILLLALGFSLCFAGKCFGEELTEVSTASAEEPMASTEELVIPTDEPEILIEEDETSIEPEVTEETAGGTELEPYNYMPVESVTYTVPKYSGTKKYESYRAFRGSSRQHLLQQNAVTLPDGLRTAGGRYCVALGSHFTTTIGQCFDLVLENGTVIPCVLGDGKANHHTDPSNIFSNTTRNWCCSEFIVDTRQLHPEAKRRGDVSYIYPEWQSPVYMVIVYELNLLEGL